MKQISILILSKHYITSITKSLFNRESNDKNIYLPLFIYLEHADMWLEPQSVK